MPEIQAQNFENHTVAPRVLFGIWLVILAGVILEVVGLFKVTTTAGICMIGTGALLIGLASIVGFGVARRYSTLVQDRVIRLEMRLRLREILPTEQQPDVMRLLTQQLVGLRFASDEEMPELVRWALDENVDDAKSIKRKVKNWQADFERV